VGNAGKLRRRGVGLVALVLLAFSAAPAAATERTYKLRAAPMSFGAYETKFPTRAMPTPGRAGFIVRMSTRLVDARGRPISIRRLMLHHVVFINSGPGAQPRNNSCPGRNGEPFFGTGEEQQRLILPPGYGYPVREHDRWRTVAMYMSHSNRPVTASLEYSVTISDAPGLVPVKPLWLRASGCDPLSSYTVPGGGAPGSADVRSHDWTIPTSGRIVAAGAHLHGGALSLDVTQPRCDDRTLLDQRPLWGMPDDLVYRVRPMLHEPGPIATGYYLSPTGIPVRRGEVLRVTASYDAELPHPRVMAITHVYIAKDADAPRGCEPLPADGQTLWSRTDGRATVAPMQVPLTRLDAAGNPIEIPFAGGPLVEAGANASVDVEHAAFEPSNLTIPSGGRVTWRFRDRDMHDVLSANAPRAVDGPMARRGGRYSQTFTVPGTYNLFCDLHPMTMHQTITVRP
jgi:plastocyanin